LSIGLYPLAVVALLYGLDKWILPPSRSGNRFTGELVGLDQLSGLIVPAFLIFLLLSAVILNCATTTWRSRTLVYWVSKSKARPFAVAYIVMGSLGLLLLCTAYYLRFAGEYQLGDFFLVGNVVAFLIVRLSRPPASWHIIKFKHSTMARIYLVVALAGLLRIGVIILGVWLSWTISLLTGEDWLQILLMSASFASSVTVGSFLILHFVRQGVFLFGKTARISAVVLFSIVPLLIILIFLYPPERMIFSTVILIFGSVVGFFLLISGPDSMGTLGPIFGWIWFYSLALGTVCMSSAAMKGLPSALITLLFILMTGMAVGINMRYRIPKYYVRGFWGLT
jgi:hypothetical protein